MRRVQGVPDGLCIEGVAAVSGAETGMVEVGQRARGGVGGQVGLEPRYHVRLSLRGALARAIFGTIRPIKALRVQHDDVPGAPVVGIVAFGGLSGPDAEVVEVAGRSGGVGACTVLVVTDRRPSTRLVVSPGGVIVGVVLSQGAFIIGVVPEGEN